MALVAAEDHPRPIRDFVAAVIILHHSTTISTG
jgi:GTPase